MNINSALRKAYVAYRPTVEHAVGNATAYLAAKRNETNVYLSARGGELKTEGLRIAKEAAVQAFNTVRENPGTALAVSVAGTSLYSAYKDFKEMNRPPVLKVTHTNYFDDQANLTRVGYSKRTYPSTCDQIVLFAKASSKIAIAAGSIALCTEAGRAALSSLGADLITQSGIEPVETLRQVANATVGLPVMPKFQALAASTTELFSGLYQAVEAGISHIDGNVTSTLVANRTDCLANNMNNTNNTAM